MGRSERERAGNGGGDERTDASSARGIISVDRRWRLQVASSFGRKTRCLPDDGILRGKPSTRDGGEETGPGTGTRTGMGAETGPRTARRVEGKNSPISYNPIAKVGWKMRGRGRRQQITSSTAARPDAPVKKTRAQ